MRLASLAICTMVLLAAPSVAATPAAAEELIDPSLTGNDPCNAIPIVGCVPIPPPEDLLKDVDSGWTIEQEWGDLDGKYGCSGFDTISNGAYLGVLRLKSCETGFFTGYVFVNQSSASEDA